MKPILVFNHTLHKDLWYWLSDHPDKHKLNWPGIRKMSEKDLEEFMDSNMCFACHTTKIEIGRMNCALCPLCWPDDTMCMDKFSAYRQYQIAQDNGWNKLVRAYAEMIANLPVRKYHGHELIVI